MKQEFLVYVLKSRVAPKSYVGITTDIERRVREHKSGKNFYTKRYTPWDLIHTEIFNSQKEAREREKYLKSGNGRKYLESKFF